MSSSPSLSLSPVLVLVVVMGSMELKTSRSHAHSLILSLSFAQRGPYICGLRALETDVFLRALTVGLCVDEAPANARQHIRQSANASGLLSAHSHRPAGSHGGDAVRYCGTLRIVALIVGLIVGLIVALCVSRFSIAHERVSAL